ncbi:MAG: hypothetical protein NTZ34_04525, partial [Chloroflexi bacterium]|nr:hypothetical protein [Chloroflexota bacterium]
MRYFLESVDTGYKKRVRGLMSSLLLAICFLMISSCASYASPILNFTYPTNTTGSYSRNSWAPVNISIGGQNLDSFRFNWNGTNTSIYDRSLVLAFNLNNNSVIGENATHVVDISRQGNNGTVYGAVWNPAGRFGGAMQFDGGDDHINVADDASLNFTDRLTLAAWLNILPDSVLNVSVGDSHTCALLAGGAAVCWGKNDYGQLGDGSYLSRNIPVPVTGGYNFTLISAGLQHTCGVLNNGSVLCWGSNAEGQLGNGSSGTSSPYPVYAAGNHLFRTVDAGYHTCGVLTNKTAMCWGPNNHGQLGNGSSGNSNPVPVYISGDYNFTAISAGWDHSCGLLVNGSALCWGYNVHGQLGNGSAGIENALYPFYVYGNYPFKQISAGKQYSCGVLNDGSGRCWGWNTNGQLGNDSYTDHSVPISVAGSHNYLLIHVSLTGSHTCGILLNGSALCWGDNYYGQLGDGT